MQMMEIVYMIKSMWDRILPVPPRLKLKTHQ